ncbi:MAG TPA: AAA family ATPase [Kaistia sp.]|nr:AAA family ATPase [Kaistia sp.]
MRLDRLGLTRYGRFTGRVLDFGARPVTGPDLHIVYGPNEAGKSTTLAAWLDLLYGIGTQSPYNFLHPYATMRIEGTLELEGHKRAFTRIKKPQNSLLDPSDQVLPDAAILAELGGITRDAYRTMFSLDDETLVAGGESILASRGDLGQLLFSASAGLAELGQRLERLKQEADAFHKPAGRKTALADLKARLGLLKDEREQVDTLASTHARLVEAEKTAGTAYDAATAERGRVQAEIDALTRQLGALPRLAALHAARAELAPLADLPEPPPDWAAELPALQHADVALATRRAGLRDEAATLERALAALAEDPDALAEAENFDLLDERAARHMTAARDLPARQLERAEAERTIADLLARIGQADAPDPHSLLISAPQAARLMALVEQRSGIVQRLATAKAELAAAEADLAEAAARQGPDVAPMPPTSDAMALLVATVKSLRAEDIDGRRQRAHRDRALAEAALADSLATLAPWQGDAEALSLMIVPDASEIASWKSRLETGAGEVTLHRGDVDRLVTQLAREAAELAALAAFAGQGSDQEAVGARLQRETAWAHHRSLLDEESAAAFEAAMRRDDIATNARLVHVADTARHAQIAQVHAITEAEHRRAAELHAAALARLQAERERIASAVGRLVPGLMEAAGLGGFETWLRRRERALEARAALRAADAAWGEAEAIAKAAKERLAAALQAVGWAVDPAADIDTMRMGAEAGIEAATAVEALRRQVEERQRAVDRRVREQAEAAAADAAWTDDWQAALAGSWLAAVDPPVGAIREMLDGLKELGTALGKVAGLADRIDKMTSDQLAYRAALDSVASRLGMASDDETGTLATRLRNRIRAARDTQKELQSLSTRLAENADAEVALVREEVNIRRKINAMTEHFGVEGLTEVAQNLAAISDRARLSAEIRAAEQEIAAALGMTDIGEAESVLAVTDREALAAEKAALQQRFEDLVGRCQQLFAEWSTATDRLAAIGGDGAVAAIEARRRTVLVEIEEGALRYLRLRAGVGAAEAALRLYREKHRSQMMARASEAFRTISRGAYSGLASQADKDGERLIALVAGGGSKAAAELSKGTRYQLYLALRVAGYHEFAETRRAVPFIADDIMESFDDFRAEEAFRLFAGMAEVGQVIYLTHHQHLIPIAESVCPGVRVHRLDMD